MPDTDQRSRATDRRLSDDESLETLPWSALANKLTLAAILLTAALFRLAYVTQPLTDA